MIAATADGAFLFNDTPRARPLATWVRGSVALLGDAAHPTLGSGGGLAIEDAAVLGESLRSTGPIQRREIAHLMRGGALRPLR